MLSKIVNVRVKHVWEFMMPSISFHDRWCFRFVQELGYSEGELCLRVNRLIDKGELHDVGRRIPEGITVDPIRQIRLKLYEKNIREIICNNEVFGYAFFLHHILDIMFLTFVSNVNNEQLLLDSYIKEKVLTVLRLDAYRKLLEAPRALEVRIFDFINDNYVELVHDMFREKQRKSYKVLERLHANGFLSKIVIGELNKERPSLFKLTSKLWLINKVLNNFSLKDKISPKVVERIRVPLRDNILDIAKRTRKRETKVSSTLKYKYSIKALKKGLARTLNEAQAIGTEAMNIYEAHVNKINSLYKVISSCIPPPTVKFHINSFLQSIKRYLHIRSPEIAYVITTKLLGIFIGTYSAYGLTVDCIRNVAITLGYPYNGEVKEGIRETKVLLKELRGELKSVAKTL